MQIHAKPTLIIIQYEPRNLKHDIPRYNAEQEASILISTSIVQITLLTSEQSPEDFCFEIIGMSLSKLATKSIKSKTIPQ